MIDIAGQIDILNSAVIGGTHRKTLELGAQWIFWEAATDNKLDPGDKDTVAPMISHFPIRTTEGSFIRA